MLEGKKLLGRPRFEWKENIKSDLRTLNIEKLDEIGGWWMDGQWWIATDGDKS